MLFYVPTLLSNSMKTAKTASITKETLMKPDRQFKTGPWTVAEVKQLTDLYPSTQNAILADLMGRSKRSVDQCAVRLGLRKTFEHNRKMKDQFYSLRHGLTSQPLGETSRPPRTIPFVPYVPKPLPLNIGERIAAFRAIPSYQPKGG
jgi:hypothetical protein